MKTKIYLILIGIMFPVIMNAQWTAESTGFATPARGLWDLAINCDSLFPEDWVWGIASDYTTSQLNPIMEMTRSTDGISFTACNFPFNCYWSNITAVDSMTAWVSGVNPATGSDGAIYKTIDGGLTWNEQGVNTIFNSTSYVDFVYFFNNNEGVTMGDPNSSEFEIYTTIDGGTTWTPVPGSSIPDPLAGEIGFFKNYFEEDDHIWFGTNKARIFHSADKGLTWEVLNTGISMPNMYDYIEFCFWNPSNGIARKYDVISGQNVEVRNTNDGGQTWNPVTVTGDFFGSIMGGIAYVPGTTSTLISTGIYGNGAPGSSYSNDGGLTWTTIDNVGHYVTRFFNNTIGWSAGVSIDSTNGGIFKYTGVPLGVKNIETGKDVFFNVYPNPSKGKVLIQMGDAGNQNVLVTVNDFTGRQVFETTFEKPGEFFLQNIDVTSLPAGAFFLKLSYGGNAVTRKIIID
jgi:photosystem II stability/assembly factor-like uncharacterized protein